MWRLAGTAIWTPVLYLFWLAILGTGFGADKYNAYSLGLYYIAISFIDFFAGFDVNSIAEDIREGYLATDLVKPYSYFGKIFLGTFADKAVHLVIFSLLYLVLIIFGIKTEITFAGFIIALVFLALATLMSFFLAATIGSFGFWFNKINGFNSLFHNFGGLFSGYLIPISLLPPAMAAISNYMPYKYMFFVPASLFIKTPEIPELLQLFSIQIFWLMFSLALLKFVWSKGLNRFEAVGR